MPGLKVQRLLLVLPVLGALAGLGAYFALQGGPCACLEALMVRGTTVTPAHPGGEPGRPAPGVVEFVSAGGSRTSTTTASDGTFSITLYTGRYRVEWHRTAESFPSCPAGSITVRQGTTTTLVIACPRR